MKESGGKGISYKGQDAFGSSQRSLFIGKTLNEKVV